MKGRHSSLAGPRSRRRRARQADPPGRLLSGAAALLRTGSLVALLLLPAVASADTWSWDDERSELELRNFYKSMVTGLRLPPPLVDANLVPAYGVLWTHATRTWGHLVLKEKYELQVGYQLAAVIASDPALSTGAGLGTSVPASTARAERRLVDFDPLLVKRGGMSLYHDLDLLAVKADLGKVDVTVGRQVLSWGSGRLWNPTDLLSPFAPTDIDREVRRGVDALRVSIPFSETAQLDVLWLPLPELRDHGGVARAQVNIKSFDIAPSVAKYVRDAVFGLDVTGDAGPVGVHTEAAYTVALDTDERFVRAVVGAELRPTDELVLIGEYYYNGFGARDPAGYLDVLQSDRVARGEVFGAGRHYAGIVAAYKYSELLNVQAIAITNLLDPSLLVVPAVEYWAEQKVLVRAGAYLPVGRSAEVDASGLTLHSEYGVAPFGAFAQIAIYLL